MTRLVKDKTSIHHSMELAQVYHSKYYICKLIVIALLIKTYFFGVFACCFKLFQKYSNLDIFRRIDLNRYILYIDDIKIIEIPISSFMLT